MKDLIGTYPVSVEIPVAWGEMDAFQHVNNTVYFKYFEIARIKYFEKIDFIKIMTDRGIGPILSSTSCQYKIPLTYPDHVTAYAKVSTLKKDRFIMEYAVFSRKVEKIAALGEGTLVTYDYQNNQKTDMPDDLRKTIIDLEKKTDQQVTIES